MKFNRITERGIEDIGLDDMPTEIREQFEADMAAFDNAEEVRLIDVLRNGGYEVPLPSDLADDELADAIRHVAEGLSLLRVYLENSDHLSDRALYRFLYDEALVEPTTIFPRNPNFGYHIDAIGAGTDDDVDVWLKYYADEETRENWRIEFGIALPQKAVRPYDRDRKLPKRSWVFEEPVEH